MKTQNYKITWTTDDTNNLYERSMVIKTDYDVEEQEATITAYVEGDSDPICETFSCEEGSEIDYTIDNFITDSLSYLTECDDRFIIGTTERGDFVDVKLLAETFVD